MKISRSVPFIFHGLMIHDDSISRSGLFFFTLLAFLGLLCCFTYALDGKKPETLLEDPESTHRAFLVSCSSYFSAQLQTKTKNNKNSKTDERQHQNTTTRAGILAQSAAHTCKCHRVLVPIIGFGTKMPQIPFKSQIQPRICCKHRANNNGHIEGKKSNRCRENSMRTKSIKQEERNAKTPPMPQRYKIIF